MGMFKRMAGIAVAAVVLAAAPVQAQMFRGGMRSLTEPDMTSKDLEQAAAVLQLDEEQLAVGEELLKSYLVNWEALRGKISTAMDGARQEFRETQDPAVWMDFQKVSDGFQDEKKAMTDQFMADLKLMLTEDQLELWPKVERQRRRVRSLEQSFLSGEGVDVIELVKEMELAPESAEAVAPILDRYEVELDRALEQRDKIYESGMDRGMELWQNQDFETMEKLFAEARDAGIKVRDTHRRAVKQIMSVLTPEQGAAFETAFKEASFPQVYRRSFAVRAFETADEMADLTEDQRTQIADLRAQLDRELATRNDAMAESIEKEEMTRTIQGMMGMGRRGPGGDREARQAKRDLEMAMMDRLKSVLTPEQQALLPEPEQQRDWRGFGRGDETDQGGDNERPRRIRGGQGDGQDQDGV